MPAETSLSSSQARHTLATTSGAQLATPKSGLLPALPMTDRTSHAYALRQEAKEAKEAKEALLNPIVKQLILDTTLRELAAQSQVAPATKVLTRNENEYAAKTIKEIAAERQARKKVIQVTGFNADPHAPYKALGDPILDPQELVYRTMKLDIPTRSGNRRKKTDAARNLSAVHVRSRRNSADGSIAGPAPSRSNTGSANVKSTGIAAELSANRAKPSTAASMTAAVESTPATGTHRSRTGHSLIIQRLRAASQRVQAVKYGVQYETLIHREAAEARAKAPPSVLRQQQVVEEEAQVARRSNAGGLSRTGSTLSIASNTESVRNGGGAALQQQQQNIALAPIQQSIAFDVPGWANRLARVQNLEQKKMAEALAKAPKVYGAQPHVPKSIKVEARMAMLDLDKDSKAFYTGLYERNVLGLGGVRHKNAKMGHSNRFSSTGTMSTGSMSSMSIAALASPANDKGASSSVTQSANEETPVPTTNAMGDITPEVDGEMASPSNALSLFYGKKIADRMDEFDAAKTKSIQALTTHVRKNDLERSNNFHRNWEALNFVMSGDATSAAASMQLQSSQVKKRNAAMDSKRQLRRMRIKACEMKVAERLSGYHDLFNDVSSGNATSGMNMFLSDALTPAQLKQHERMLMKRVREFIEKDADFNKETFAALLVTIPQKHFQNDRLQKIFRFLKNNLFKMSERDYLEFLTANGYAPTQLNTTGAGTATMVDMDQTAKQHTEKNRSRRVSIGGRLNAIDET